jgi:HEPN domain-containing protein
MPPKKTTFGTAQEGLKRAKGNLALAKQPKPKEAFWDDLCFDAQQAAEKSIKAVLVHREIDFPKTHNIPAEPVTRNEYRQAAALARKVIKWQKI